MPLNIQINRNAGSGPGVVTMALTGTLDSATAPDLERELAPVLAAETTKDIVFDLAALKFISSAGLRIFAASRKSLQHRGGQVSLIHMQPQIEEVFAIIKALPGVAVFQDVAELDHYLAVRQRSYLEKT